MGDTLFDQVDDDGEFCPHCKQKIRKLNPHRMDLQKWKVLDSMARLQMMGHAWVRVEHGNKIGAGDDVLATSYRAEAHVGRLKWFGLVDHKGHRTGEYRVNRAGFEFLSGRGFIPEVIWCRDGRVVKRSTETVRVDQIKKIILTKEYWDRYSQVQVPWPRDNNTGESDDSD